MTTTIFRAAVVNDAPRIGTKDGLSSHPLASAVPATGGPDSLDTPPRFLLCTVDHDDLQPRTERYGRAVLTYWSCPACDYYFTAITAKRPKKADMSTNVTLVDRLTIVKQLATPKTMDFVVASNKHLTESQVRTIAADHGYPQIANLREAARVLQRAYEESLQPKVETSDVENELARRRHVEQIKAEHQVAVPETRKQSPPQPSRPQPVGQPMRQYDATAALLAEAADSKKKSTRTLATRVEALLIDLRDRVKAEKKENDLREHQAAERKRLAEKANREAEQLKAEIAAAEDALRALKAKARGVKTPSKPKPRGTGDRTAQGAAASQRHARVKALGGIGVIRAWAVDQGLEVGKVGLVPSHVVDAYEQAHIGEKASA